MKTRTLIITLIIALGLMIPAFGQVSLDDLNLTSSGARARAMGGAFSSIADDGTALFWNPAGLIQVLDPQVSIAIDYYHPKSTHLITYADNSARNLDAPFSKNKSPLTLAVFTAPIRIKNHQFVASAGYSVVSNRLEKTYTRVNIEDVDSAFVYSDINDCRLNKLMLGFGTNLYKQLNFGAGINIYFGEGVNNYYRDYTNHVLHPTQHVPIDSIVRAAIADTISYSGLNFTTGFHWNGEKFGIGAMVQTPFWITQEHVKHIADTVWVNGLINSDPATIDELPKERLEVPWAITLGASYNVTEKLLLASDFEWRRYGIESIRIHYDTILSNGDLQETFNEVSLPTENGYQLKFGAEYVLDGGFAQIPIRAGYRFETFGWLQTTDESYFVGEIDVDNEGADSLVVSNGYGDQLTGSTISVGFGLHWSLIRLDFALEMVNRDYDYNGTDAFGAFESVIENRSSRLIMNFTGLFK